MLYSFSTRVYIFLTGNVTLSFTFSCKMLLVAEETAFQRRKRKLPSCKPKIVCAHSKFKRSSVTFKRSWICILKSKNIHCVERAVKVALQIFSM